MPTRREKNPSPNGETGEGREVRDHKPPYYDAQIWATARLNQVPVVFSEDSRDRTTLEDVPFVNPFTPEILIEITTVQL